MQQLQINTHSLIALSKLRELQGGPHCVHFHSYIPQRCCNIYDYPPKSCSRVSSQLCTHWSQRCLHGLTSILPFIYLAGCSFYPVNILLAFSRTTFSRSLVPSCSLLYSYRLLLHFIFLGHILYAKSYCLNPEVLLLTFWSTDAISLVSISTTGSVVGIGVLELPFQRQCSQLMLHYKNFWQFIRAGHLCLFIPCHSKVLEVLHMIFFPCSSAGKESACNAGDPGSISGSGRSPGEGIATHSSILGFPLWFSW